MAHIIFYTKTGCRGGIRQKELLQSFGHTVEERSLLDEAWTPETLLPYLDGLAVEEWFNPNAPAVKEGRVIPGALSPEETLLQLCGDPILIKRPLMNIEGRLVAGFDADQIKSSGLGEVPQGYQTGCQMNDQAGACSS
ncbi:ArsC family protein [compost metagenome]